MSTAMEVAGVASSSPAPQFACLPPSCSEFAGQNNDVGSVLGLGFLAPFIAGIASGGDSLAPDDGLRWTQLVSDVVIGLGCLLMSLTIVSYGRHTPPLSAGARRVVFAVEHLRHELYDFRTQEEFCKNLRLLCNDIHDSLDRDTIIMTALEGLTKVLSLSCSVFVAPSTSDSDELAITHEARADEMDPSTGHVASVDRRMVKRVVPRNDPVVQEALSEQRAITVSTSDSVLHRYDAVPHLIDPQSSAALGSSARAGMSAALGCSAAPGIPLHRGGSRAPGRSFARRLSSTQEEDLIAAARIRVRLSYPNGAENALPSRSEQGTRRRYGFLEAEGGPGRASQGCAGTGEIKLPHSEGGGIPAVVRDREWQMQSGSSSIASTSVESGAGFVAVPRTSRTGAPAGFSESMAAERQTGAQSRSSSQSMGWNRPRVSLCGRPEKRENRTPITDAASGGPSCETSGLEVPPSSSGSAQPVGGSKSQSVSETGIVEIEEEATYEGKKDDQDLAMAAAAEEGISNERAGQDARARFLLACWYSCCPLAEEGSGTVPISL
ncbi:hypothetical protein CBR_g11041 [Chara braunii]|uniref:Uncharacterized protein n=1 Tax=Chara braunii TaxID=69332 RepID=A0A388KQ26_CHABU|nr:hypothetical protein CBR_g11041 [Chara braunii]|eukprot:GBG72108.1 hypothetical protein CBR_g11041 [Chara braunii]